MRFFLGTCFLLLLTANDVDASSNRPRRRLSEVDIDAATGSVQNAAAAECDEQLKQALVQANDAKFQAHKERDAALAGKTEAMDQVAQLESVVQGLQTQVSGKTEAMDQVAKLESVVQGLQTQVSSLNTQLQESQTLLETTREEAKKYLVEQVAQVQAELDQKTKEHQQALDKKDATVKELNEKATVLLEGQKKLETIIQEKDQELVEWIDSYETRSYCNVTMITDDLQEAGMQLYADATTAASDLTRQGQELYEQVKDQTEKGYEMTKKVYNEQYEEHWPKVKPHYDQHVAPLVQEFGVWKTKQVDPQLAELNKEYQQLKKREIDPRIALFHKERKQLFAKMVKAYGEHCQDFYKTTVRLSKEHVAWDDFWSPVQPYIQQSCREAEPSVEILLKVLAVVVLFMLRRQIFGIFWAILGLAWSIFLTVTLLRFILPSSKPEPVKQPASNGPSLPHVPASTPPTATPPVEANTVRVKKKKSKKKH